MCPDIDGPVWAPGGPAPAPLLIQEHKGIACPLFSLLLINVAPSLYPLLPFKANTVIAVIIDKEPQLIDFTEILHLMIMFCGCF